MRIPHTFLKADNTLINAFRVGLELFPQWAIDLAKNNKIELLDEESGIGIKIGTKIAKHGDYILNINDKPSIMTADNFDKTYSPKTITTEG